MGSISIPKIKNFDNNLLYHNYEPGRVYYYEPGRATVILKHNTVDYGQKGYGLD